MDAETLIELKRQSKVLLSLNEDYHKYLYITNIESISQEKKRLLKKFGYDSR